MHSFVLVLVLPLLATGKMNYDYLECTYNRYLAECIGDQVHLKRLYNSGLREFPVLKDGENCLQLEQNYIAKFPDDMDNLKTVVSLNVAGNQISQLPDNLDVMSELQILDVSKNRLFALSPKTRFPASLRGLLLKENKMKTVPDGIQIPGLFVLDLSGNLFTEITRHFCVSDQLIRVDYINNPLAGDMSRYVNVIDQCRNTNNIPFCLFTDLQTMTCDCSSLGSILDGKSSFCMGNPLAGHHVQCSDTNSSGIEYRGEKLFDIDANMVRANCSLGLKQSASNVMSYSNTLLFLAFLIGKLYTFT